MKSALVLTALAIAAPFVAAADCTQGLYYCGSTLLVKGDYRDQIVDALKDAGKPTDGIHINDSLFYCRGGGNGDIDYQNFCGSDKCVEAAAGVSDYCQ